MTLTDPKPARRIVDPDALAKHRAKWYRCVACRFAYTEAHHLIPKSHGGDDLLDNLLPLCRGCHGAIHDGAAYQRNGSRITPELTRSRIGRYLASEDGRRYRAYVLGKLGRRPGKAWLRKQFGVVWSQGLE